MRSNPFRPLPAAALACFVALASFAQATEDDGKPGRIGPGAPPAGSAPAAPAAAQPPAKSSEKSIHLAPTTPVGAAVHVHQKVLDECRIQTLLPQSIVERAPGVELSTKPGGTRLELTIVDVHAPSGGVFSGPKWITVEGKLLQGKTVKGDFVAKETSMASASACGMLSKVIVVLAGDIAAWLENPTKGSRLGSAR